MVKKEKKTIGNISLVVIIFLIAFLITFFLSSGLIKKSGKDVVYNNINFISQEGNNLGIYNAEFFDSAGRNFTYSFFNNPNTLDKIKIEGKIEIKNNTYVLVNSKIDECANFQQSSTNYAIFLFKLGTLPEIRPNDNENNNFNKYRADNSTIIIIKQNKFWQAQRIIKTDYGYDIYIKKCYLEKGFERFILGDYFNKQDIKLNNQEY